jgi:hypothetical protein
VSGSSQGNASWAVGAKNCFSGPPTCWARHAPFGGGVLPVGPACASGGSQKSEAKDGFEGAHPWQLGLLLTHTGRP